MPQTNLFGFRQLLYCYILECVFWDQSRIISPVEGLEVWLSPLYRD